MKYTEFLRLVDDPDGSVDGDSNMADTSPTGERSTESGERTNSWIDLGRRQVLKATAAGAVLGFGASSPASAQTIGGPVVLMGIDAEEGAPTGHGGTTTYVPIVNEILATVTNGNSGILVVGGKSGTNTETFWNTIGSNTGESVTYVNGATDIGTATFSNYAMVGVVSTEGEVFPGGLTDAENAALIDRATDLKAFINDGGGLLGFSQVGLTDPWGYLGEFGTITIQYDDYVAIRTTPEGDAVGIPETDLDVVAWHDAFYTFPSFLDVLAINDDSTAFSYNEAAALGGARVVVSACDVRETALLADQDVDIGSVTVEQTGAGSSLFVTYSTTGDWYMTETHLAVAEGCDDIPQTGGGNPQVGQFEFSDTHDPPVQEHTVEVPLDADWASDDTLCLAAHADVFRDENDSGTFESGVDRGESAWGDGDPFTDRGNWATNFDYDVC